MYGSTLIADLIHWTIKTFNNLIILGLRHQFKLEENQNRTLPRFLKVNQIYSELYRYFMG
jgi:hypothetical protein